jgi:hypothetical protein
MLGQSIYDCLEYIYQNFQQYQKFVLKINNLINIFSLNIFQYSINCFSLNDLTNQFRKKFSFLNRYLFLFNTENFFSKTLKFQYLSFNENINMKTKNESLQKTSVFLKMKKQKKKNRTYLITEKLDPKNKKTKLNSMFNKTFFYDVTFVHFFQLKYIQKTILWLFLKNCSKNSIRWSQFLPSPLPFAKPLVSTIDRYPCHRYICQSVIFITNKQIKFSLFRNKTQKPLKYKILSFFSKKTKNFENKTQNGKKKKVSKKYWKKRLSIKCFCFIYNPLKFESKHFLLSRKIKLRNEITLFHFKEKNKDNVKFSCLFFEKEKEGIKFFGTESSKGQTKDFSILKKNHLKIQNGLFSISKIQCENIFLSISPNYEILFKFFNSICYWFQKYGIFCSFFTLKNSISGLDLAGFYITQKKKTNKKIPVFLDIPESFYQTFFSDSLSFETFSSKEFHSCFSFFLQKKKRRNKVYILFKQFLTDCIKNLSDQKKQLNANLLIEKKKFSQFLPLFFQNKTFLKNNKENFQQSFFPFYKQFNKNFINSNKIVPSKLNFKNYLNKIQFFIQMSKSKSQTKLIQQLSPLITMWCFYYKTISQKKILNLCDQIISQAIWRWACRKHANKSKGWVRHKYYWSYNINKAEKLIQKKRQNNDLIYNLSPSSKKLMTLEKKSFDFVNEFSSKLSNNNTTLSQFHLQKKKSNSRIWEFCTYNSLQQSFYCLPKHKNTKLVRHLKRFQHSSLYDKNWKYWINRCHLTGPNILPEL